MDTPRRVAKVQDQRVEIIDDSEKLVRVKWPDQSKGLIPKESLSPWSPEDEISFQLDRLIASTNALADSIAKLTEHLKEKDYR